MPQVWLFLFCFVILEVPRHVQDMNVSNSLTCKLNAMKEEGRENENASNIEH